MGAEERKPDNPIIARFKEEFYRYSFFNAVTLLETLLPDKHPLGQSMTPSEEAVRFTVKPSLLFPASEISKVTDKEEGPLNLEVAFMGLIGPTGVFPYWHNEMVLQRNREKDFTINEFYNLFHHRLISLFYLAWKKYRFPVNYLPGAKDKLSSYVLSLTGLGTIGLQNRIGFPEDSLAYYSGLFSKQVASAIDIASAVAYYADVEADVDQLIERMLQIEEEDQTQLGVLNCELGRDALVGSHIWECQSKFRVKLGPIDFKRFLSFLPGEKLLQAIFSLIRYMVGLEYEFSVRLVIKGDTVPSCILGQTGAERPLLGWSTWLKHPDYNLKENPYITFNEDDL